MSEASRKRASVDQEPADLSRRRASSCRGLESGARLRPG